MLRLTRSRPVVEAQRLLPFQARGAAGAAIQEGDRGGHDGHDRRPRRRHGHGPVRRGQGRHAGPPGAAAGHDRAGAEPRGDRRRPAAPEAAGDRGDPRAVSQVLRGGGDARVEAGPGGRRDGPRRRAGAVGQLRLDRDLVVEGLRGRRPRPLLSIAAQHPLLLDEPGRPAQRDGRALPAARRARGPRGARRVGPAARRDPPDDQLVGLPRARARPRRDPPRPGPGRLVHAGPLRRRRPDAAGPPPAPPRRGARCLGLGPQHRHGRLLAGAV